MPFLAAISICSMIDLMCWLILTIHLKLINQTTVIVKSTKENTYSIRFFMISISDLLNWKILIVALNFLIKNVFFFVTIMHIHRGSKRHNTSGPFSLLRRASRARCCCWAVVRRAVCLRLTPESRFSLSWTESTRLVELSCDFGLLWSGLFCTNPTILVKSLFSL